MSSPNLMLEITIANLETGEVVYQKVLARAEIVGALENQVLMHEARNMLTACARYTPKMAPPREAPSDLDGVAGDLAGDVNLGY